MKALKNKITDELKKIEHRESISELDLSKNTLEHVFWLSKTLCYLEKAEHIMAGTYDSKAVAEV